MIEKIIAWLFNRLPGTMRLMYYADVKKFYVVDAIRFNRDGSIDMKLSEYKEE